jgi:hypothetical protein
VNKFLVLLSICVIFVANFGCQEQAAAVAGPSKSYNLMGEEVSFVTPASPWVETVQTIGDDNAELGMPADTILGITFRRPDKDGLIAVGALGQQKDKDGKFIELENDQETLNQIAGWVDKRDGERVGEEYIKVLGVNAFHMTFEVGPEDRREKGEQVHFTKDGRHYTLSILVPAQDYDAQIGQFRNLVAAFTTK